VLLTLKINPDSEQNEQISTKEFMTTPLILTSVVLAARHAPASACWKRRVEEFAACAGKLIHGTHWRRRVAGSEHFHICHWW